MARDSQHSQGSKFVGVDVGGTTCTIAMGDSARRIHRISDQFPTRSYDGPAATVEDIVNEINKVLGELNWDPTSVHQICLATPGPATRDGVLLKTPNLDSTKWDRCPIRQLLQDQFNRTTDVASVETPVSYLGDGQAAAVGEFCVRTGRIHWPELDDTFVPSEGVDFGSLAMVAVGTGLGGGEVRNGEPVQGVKGRAGHAGHLLLPAFAFRHQHDQQLKVGNAFCTAESAVSLTALTHQLAYRLTLPEWSDHSLHQVDGTTKDKAKRLRELAAEGDELAIELFEDQAKALGITLLMVNYVGDHDLLVIGGGVCDLSPELRDRYLSIVKQSYETHALDGFRNFDAINFSVCGDNASVIGALAHSYGV